LQRAWPWHLSWSTRIFSFPAIAAFPFVWRALPRGVLLSAFFGAPAQTRRHTAKLYRITFATPLCCQV